MGEAAADIDAYIAAAAAEARAVLRQIRRLVRRAAPKSTEVISYRMPAAKGHGILLYFAAFKAHIGIFPPVAGDARLEKALAPYRGPKGNLRFPLDEPIPYALIERIVRLRARQDSARAAGRKAVAPSRKRTGARRPPAPDKR